MSKKSWIFYIILFYFNMFSAKIIMKSATPHNNVYISSNFFYSTWKNVRSWGAVVTQTRRPVTALPSCVWRMRSSCTRFVGTGSPLGTTPSPVWDTPWWVNLALISLRFICELISVAKFGMWKMYRLWKLYRNVWHYTCRGTVV